MHWRFVVSLQPRTTCKIAQNKNWLSRLGHKSSDIPRIKFSLEKERQKERTIFICFKVVTCNAMAMATMNITACLNSYWVYCLCNHLTIMLHDVHNMSNSKSPWQPCISVSRVWSTWQQDTWYRWWWFWQLSFYEFFLLWLAFVLQVQRDSIPDVPHPFPRGQRWLCRQYGIPGEQLKRHSISDHIFQNGPGNEHVQRWDHGAVANLSHDEHVYDQLDVLFNEHRLLGAGRSIVTGESRYCHRDDYVISLLSNFNLIPTSESLKLLDQQALQLLGNVSFLTQGC